MAEGPFDLSGRVAIVTGAGSGVGRASAIALAGAGATVVCADLDAGTASETAQIARAGGGRAESVHLNLTDIGTVRATVTGARGGTGGWMSWRTWPTQ